MSRRPYICRPARYPAAFVVPLLALLTVGARATVAHLSAQLSPDAVAYAHVATLGTTGLPWQRSAA